MKKFLYASMALVIAFEVPVSHAGWPCSIDDAYPEVAELNLESGELVATLGNYFAIREPLTETDDNGYRELRYPRLILSPDGEWTFAGYGDRPNWSSALQGYCMDAPPDVEGAWREKHGVRPMYDGAENLFSQSIVSCASDGQTLWGGISFYGGEGYWGVGGLARQDRSTGEVRFIRPAPQRFTASSTGPIAFFAGTLWMGSYYSGECGGPHPGNGLKKLEHYPSMDHYVAEDVPEVCGFAIRDFQEFDGALWAATELGLSRLDDDGGPVWTNYVPDLEHPDLMREIGCDDLYKELLQSERLAETAGFDIGNAFDVFWRRLSNLRPEFATRYLRELHGLPTEDYPRGY